ncbi:hypothetical protein FCL40_02025 [Ferrimonas sediminicola]|uniref:Uncharacterized protein n=1 Tax=Ferrimonas sediminicola TaxID=2569538 RepID=A0A4U1BMK2_9GAMM|nr:dienelactone hydrolase family protein [Ferrimonas sediminicola]TKB51358.1 hypothetical protein FCL40_02025 [Ferrimonas sediminicola]
MSLLWVTDIWGQHASLKGKIEDLNERVGSCTLLDPYAGQPFAFNDQQQAYDYFLCRCSKAGYVDKLEAWLEAHDQPVTLLGFSAGANAIATLLSRRRFPQVEKVILVYGSELPKLKVPLTVETHLLLCRGDEGSDALAQAQWPASLKLTDAPHGFINPRAPAYDAQQAHSAWEWISQRL